MPHREYGARYGATDGTPTPLQDYMGRLTESPLRTLEIIEAWDETSDVSLPIDMIMQ